MGMGGTNPTGTGTITSVVPVFVLSDLKYFMRANAVTGDSPVPTGAPGNSMGDGDCDLTAVSAPFTAAGVPAGGGAIAATGALAWTADGTGAPTDGAITTATGALVWAALDAADDAIALESVFFSSAAASAFTGGKGNRHTKGDGDGGGGANCSGAGPTVAR